MLVSNDGWYSNMSSVQNPCWLRTIRNRTYQSISGIITIHYKTPYQPISTWRNTGFEHNSISEDGLQSLFIGTYTHDVGMSREAGWMTFAWVYKSIWTWTEIHMNIDWWWTSYQTHFLTMAHGWLKIIPWEAWPYLARVRAFALRPGRRVEELKFTSRNRWFHGGYSHGI